MGNGKERWYRRRKVQAILYGLILILIPAFCQAATIADTLRAVADRGEEEWELSGLGTDSYDRVDDWPFDDDTYLYAGVGSEGYLTGFRFDDIVGTNEIDSIQFWARGYYTGGNSGNARVAFGRGCFDSEGSTNYWCINDYDEFCNNISTGIIYSADTITLTDAAADYWIRSFTGDPCREDAAWDSTFFNESMYPSWHRSMFQIECVEVRTGGAPTRNNRVTELWIVAFYEGEEAAGSKSIHRKMRNLRGVRR